MIMQYWSTRPGFAKLGIGTATETDYISDLAFYMDTNDLNPDKNKGTDGHFGTYGIDVSSGLADFIKARDDKIKLTAVVEKFTAAAIKREIDANRPVFIMGRQPGTVMPHSIIGTGYITGGGGQLEGLIARDSASLNPEENGLDLPTGAEDISITLDKPGGRANFEGDIDITEFLLPPSSPIVDAVMIDINLELVPEPSTWAMLIAGAASLFVFRGRRFLAINTVA